MHQMAGCRINGHITPSLPPWIIISRFDESPTKPWNYQGTLAEWLTRGPAICCSAHLLGGVCSNHTGVDSVSFWFFARWKPDFTGRTITWAIHLMWTTMNLLDHIALISFSCDTNDHIFIDNLRDTRLFQNTSCRVAHWTSPRFARRWCLRWCLKVVRLLSCSIYNDGISIWEHSSHTLMFTYIPLYQPCNAQYQHVESGMCFWKRKSGGSRIRSVVSADWYPCVSVGCQWCMPVPRNVRWKSSMDVRLQVTRSSCQLSPVHQIDSGLMWLWSTAF
jgi:hypothetical protein